MDKNKSMMKKKRNKNVRTRFITGKNVSEGATKRGRSASAGSQQ